MCKVIDYTKGEIIPTRKTAWINLEIDEIIERYNRVLFTVEKQIQDKKQLRFLRRILENSAACTIMNKMRLRSRRQVFLKYGKDFLKKKGEDPPIRIGREAVESRMQWKLHVRFGGEENTRRSLPYFCYAFYDRGLWELNATINDWCCWYEFS